MKSLAFLFPGQGSQNVGMGQDFFNAAEAAQQVFERGCALSGLPLTEICFNGPMDRLTQTDILQPALTVVDLAICAALNQRGIFPDFVAGHSLGEYSALYAAGVLSLDDAIRAVCLRGSLMHRESQVHRGAMQAIVGLTRSEVDALVDQGRSAGVVAVANHNAEKQVVITGEPAAVAHVADLAMAQKARAIPLKVSGAWHSPLIQGAEAEFAAFLAGVTFNPPRCQVILNVTGSAVSDPQAIREIMQRQLCSPVRWYDTMQALIAHQVSSYLEVGPGKVLTNLIKSTLPKDSPARLLSINAWEKVAETASLLT